MAGVEVGNGANEAELEAEASDVIESTTLQMGRSLIGFWNGLARTVCVAFLYGLFWCLAAAGYLLLRRDVDEMEMDEIYVVDDWEVKREDTKLLEELGKGSFGMVYRGIYTHPDTVRNTSAHSDGVYVHSEFETCQ